VALAVVALLDREAQQAHTLEATAVVVQVHTELGYLLLGFLVLLLQVEALEVSVLEVVLQVQLLAVVALLTRIHQPEALERLILAVEVQAEDKQV
jgi:hypothetical protein